MRAAVRRAPATLLLLLLALFAGAVQASGATLAPEAAHAAIAQFPPGLVATLMDMRRGRIKIARDRAEAHLIDFVELMWPVLEPEQPFVRSWVQEAICEHLEAVHHGRITNLLANVPPGSTKSMLVNVFFPAWEWGPRNRPDLRYMSWSYSPKLTEDANEACRRLIQHEVYQRFWGDRFELLTDSNAKGYYKNDRGGWRRASSVGGAATGFRADRLIWDDPHNVKDTDSVAALKEATRWFARTLPTRVRNASGDIARVRVPFWVREVHGLGLDDDPDDGARRVTQSATIGIMQRVHLHDIAGIVLKNPTLGYEILLIEMRHKGAAHPARNTEHWRGSSIGYRDPRDVWLAAIDAQIDLVTARAADALNPEWAAFERLWLDVARARAKLADPVRFPEDAVQRLEAQLMLDGGSDAVAAQLDQWPLELGGSWFKMEWLPVIEPSDVPADVSIGKRGFDFAASATKKSDQTADARVGRSASDRKFYLWDTHAIRGGPGDVEAFLTRRHTDDERSIDWSIPEDPGTGKLYADYVVREIAAGRYVHTSREAKDKVTRAKPVSAQAEHGNFVIVRHPGWEATRTELVEFPYGDHDDLVDAISRAFAAVVAMPSRGVHGGFSGKASDTPAPAPDDNWMTGGRA